MQKAVKLILQVPHPSISNRVFSLRLKKTLANDSSINTFVKKIVVISDIGGNFQRLCKVLIRSNVINRFLNWTFDEGHLVIMGNCLDNNPDIIETLWFIYSLEDKAKSKGGHVHFILGDSEASNLNGSWRFKHPCYATGRSNIALYDGSNEIARWLQTKNIIKKIGTLLFFHGNLNQVNWIEDDLSITDINNFFRANTPFPSNDNHNYFNTTNETWGSKASIEENYEILNTFLTHFEVGTIITGHKLVSTITAFHQGKLINIHTDHINGNSESLLVKTGKFYRINEEGHREFLKIE